MNNRPVYTVSAVNRYIRQMIGEDRILRDICVKGEVSECKYHSSGHVYFTIKDTGGSLSCILFSGNRRGLSFRMTAGMSVIVYGYVGVYEQQGKYQLYARQIEKGGIGALYEAYEALKTKLEEEGLFDPAHKKTLPAYPSVLGIVTSKTGAALQDILNVSLRRNPWLQIVLCPALVQGDGAPASIVQAIRTMDAYGADVMIVGRGGGSIEDLWAFNDETVARAVYACRTPVISAVGHETDTTIIDFAADLRAPTPSAAAELAIPDMAGVFTYLQNARGRLDLRMRGFLDRDSRRLEGHKRALRAMSPGQRILDLRQTLMHLQDRMDRSFTQRLEEKKALSALYAQRLAGVSPLRQLSRGYAFVSGEDGKGISSIRQVSPGNKLQIAVTDGEIRACVTGIRELDRAKDG